jgi:endogenous inhibitor of DNA gyrase (YacG/DUF329 family)
MSQNRFIKLNSVEGIHSFFKNSGYETTDDLMSFPISELVEKSIEGETWTIIDQQDLTILIIKTENYNRKSYRNKINNFLRYITGMKIIFYTQDFTHYNLTLIYNGIYNLKFQPENPEMSSIRVLELLENREELFEYAIEDINIVLLERELTAKALIEAIKSNDDTSVKLIFQEGGLKLFGTGRSKIVVSHNDAPIPDMAVEVALEYLHEEIRGKDIDLITNLYKKQTGKDLKLISLITNKGVIYYWNTYEVSGFINYVNPLKENVIEDVIESLIAQVSYRTAFNSETFHQQFGTYSPFFILALNLFKNYIEIEQEKIRIMYEEWKNRFSKVYQSGDLDEELFLKHSYLSLLVKTVLISKLLPDNVELSSEVSLEKLFKIFDERGIPIFINDFFQWSIKEQNVQNEIFIAVREANFIVDDLFRTIYQEMVSPATRHALGEFFTPAPLARKMVEESYKLGQWVLDPACGSGTFLVEILNFINNENIKEDEKFEAISRIYGFDVNPIAVLVSRSNLLLLTNKLFINSQKIPINVYLTDSLNPIDDFKPILKTKKNHKFHSVVRWSDFGNVERFNMPAINDILIINKKFFNYPDKFGELLKELDKNLTEDVLFEDLLKKIYDNTENGWLEEKCEGESDKKLRENFEYIVRKLYKYVREDKNHIWAYLLYNAIGVRKMKEAMDGVDLIIGNPPWLTINGILSKEYKKKVKDLSNNLGIYVGGKDAPNNDLCSIFFLKTPKLYLKKGGKIFFVATAGIETGNQHSKLRLFKGFRNIFMWKFLEDVFRIHNICLGAEFGYQPLLERVKVKTQTFEPKYVNKKWIFNLYKKEQYVPYNFNSLNNDQEAKRLIPISKLKELLPTSESIYKSKFLKGADLIPRSFLFVKKVKNDLFKPDKTLQQKEPWDFYPLESFDSEPKYFFKVCKSSELVPFTLLKNHLCFLPIEEKDYKYHSDLIQPKAKEIFSILKKRFMKIQIRDERTITDLWENINHLNKLENPFQKSILKVIFNSSGSILKSAILYDSIIVDHSLFYLSLNNINEAYYLSTILNSPCLTRQIQKTGSTGASGSIRSIKKRALDFPIPQYSEKSNLHIEIISLGKKCEIEVKKIIKSLKEKKKERLKKRIRCKHCGKTYHKGSFDKYRPIHEKECKFVELEHKWSEEDWIDLKNISTEEIELR